MEPDAYPISRWDVLFAAAAALLIYAAGCLIEARGFPF